MIDDPFLKGYHEGFLAGVEACVEHLEDEFTDLDDPEFGGPIEALRDLEARMGEAFTEMGDL